MPELPEVETVMLSLQQLILGRTIESIASPYDKIIKNVTPLEFKTSLVGETFKDIKRKGKFLVFILTNKIIVSHLRMEGKYFLKKDEVLSKHDHIIFYFTDGLNLRYNDVRKFGTMHLFHTTDLNEVFKEAPLNNVALDPLDDDLDIDLLFEKLQKSNRAIKSTLLDQSIISGLGNIYVDEVCYMSRVHPEIPAKRLSRKKVELIIESSKVVLKKAIALGGTTIKSFVSSHAATGLFQNELLVHTKEICPNCGEKLDKIRVGGRGTYYCKVCQRFD